MPQLSSCPQESHPPVKPRCPVVSISPVYLLPAKAYSQQTKSCKDCAPPQDLVVGTKDGNELISSLVMTPSPLMTPQLTNCTQPTESPQLTDSIQPTESPQPADKDSVAVDSMSTKTLSGIISNN
ncbi:hypothetical protein LXL04_012619 [Taraxacum kok-saghyz]